MGSSPEPELARVGSVIGEPTRAAMLGALLGGEWLPAGELARRAGVAPSTASEHLALLVERGLLARRTAGRHRYFGLASAEVASALEALVRISPRPPGADVGESVEERAIRFARTCYDHLAGRLGVLLADTLIERGLIGAHGYQPTPLGDAWLVEFGIDSVALRRQRRTLARPCLDWSERGDHLAGAVGAAITAAMLERRWLVRMDRTRAVRLTARGRDGLFRALGMEIDGP